MTKETEAPSRCADRWRRLVYLVSLFGIFFGTALDAAEPARKSFDVPAGDAATTLAQFSAQAGGRLLYSTDAVAGIKTKTVRGEFTAQEALDRLLARTSLIARRDDKTGAVAIVPAATAGERHSSGPNNEDTALAKKKIIG